MGTQTPIPVDEYLVTPYHPDVNYSDGRIEERHVGEKEHGKLQFRVVYLLKRRKLAAFIETRLRISATRYRVPDILCLRQRTGRTGVYPTARSLHRDPVAGRSLKRHYPTGSGLYFDGRADRLGTRPAAKESVRRGCRQRIS